MAILESKTRYLSHKFYIDYKDCKEILRKQTRPYSVLIIKNDGLVFAIPFRTKISHPYSFILSHEDGAGLDFTKAVIITHNNYLAEEAIVDTFEYNCLMREKNKIISRFKRFIKDYRRWACNPQKYYKEDLCNWTSLQYFHKELGIQS